jgi:hypothetical protein
MSIYESVNPQSLRQLLSEIDSGASVLPDFQRNFVWEPAATQGLLISIASEFPAGSLLRVRDTQNAFATRVFTGAPDRGQRHTFLVLDGQQRLTSLYQAFYGVGEFRFFIDLEKVKSDEDLNGDGTFFYHRASRRGVTAMETDIAVHAEKRILPLSVIYGRDGGFWKWESDVRKLLPVEAQGQFDAEMRELHRKWIQSIEQYQFPVVTLNETATVEALCTIFETLNKTGVKLSVFELLTARFWPSGINLRELWDSAVETYPILTDYDVDAYSILQAITLVSNVPASCKKKDVLNLSANQINQHWDLVLEKLVYGLEILRDDCKVMNKKWLPTSSMLGPLAAILTISNMSRGVNVAIHRSFVRRWLWCSIFGQRYEAAANTRAEKDVNDMRIWFEQGVIPETIEQFRFDRELLREVSSQSASIYKGVICLVLGAGMGARDFHRDCLINQEMVSSGEVDDHHIFPSDFLKNQKGIEKKSLRDCVLNRTLINRTTNRMISNKAPSTYLVELNQIRNADEILSSHLIPSGQGSPLMTDNYEEFLNQRADLIVAEIERVTA